jgi:hypothetical protein
VTVHEAIHEVRKVGTIRAENGKLKVRFPEPERARLEPAIETLRHNRETALQELFNAATIPPASEWPQSLSDLAAEIGRRSGDTEAARREVWMDWAEWKAAALNRIFQEQGVTGQPGGITAATVRHGERSRPLRRE